MLKACRDAAAFAGADETGFYSDEKTQAAVLHRLLVLGESAKRVSSGTRQLHSNLPWSECARLRDRVAHDLFAIRMSVIWTVATVHAIRLARQLEHILYD